MDGWTIKCTTHSASQTAVAWEVRLSARSGGLTSDPDDLSVDVTSG